MQDLDLVETSPKMEMKMSIKTGLELALVATKKVTCQETVLNLQISTEGHQEDKIITSAEKWLMNASLARN